MISKPVLTLIWNIGHILTFSFLLNKTLAIWVSTNYLQVLIFVESHASGIEFLHQRGHISWVWNRSYITNNLSYGFLFAILFHPGLWPKMARPLLTVKNKISMFVRSGHGSVRPEHMFLILFSSASLRSAITSFLRRTMLCFCSVGRISWGFPFCFFFFFLEVQSYSKVFSATKPRNLGKTSADSSSHK